MKKFFVLGLVVAGCDSGEARREQASDSRRAAARAEERRLADDYRPVGRFRLLNRTYTPLLVRGSGEPGPWQAYDPVQTEHRALFRLDTLTGETWEFVDTTAAAGDRFSSSFGWRRVPDETNQDFTVEGKAPSHK